LRTFGASMHVTMQRIWFGSKRNNTCHDVSSIEFNYFQITLLYRDLFHRKNILKPLYEGISLHLVNIVAPLQNTMHGIDKLEDQLFVLWQNNLAKKGANWPNGKARRLCLLALFANFNTPMTQDEIAVWIETHGGRYDRQGRHLAADGWYIVSGNTRSTKMEISNKLNRNQLMLVSVDKVNPIWENELQNSRNWDLAEDDWKEQLKVFADAGRGCAICGRHFTFYDKGHLDIQLGYTKENIVPNCVECNNWAQARKLSFEFDTKTLVARPIIHRPIAQEYKSN